MKTQTQEMQMKEYKEMSTQTQIEEKREMKAQNQGSMNAVRGLLAMSVVVGVLLVTGSAQAAFTSIVVNKVAGMDAALATTSAGGVDAFFIGNAGGPEIGRMLIDFDLSSIPSNAIIQSATLRLVSGGGDGGAGGTDYFSHVGNTATISIRPTAESWTTNATWNTRDGSTGWGTVGGGALAGVVSSLTSDFVGNTSTRVDFSFTGLATLVQSWVDTPSSNNGFLIRNNDETTVALRKYMLWNWSPATAPHGFPGPTDSRPYLDVTFIPEPTSVGLVLLGSVLIARKCLRRK